MDALYANPCFMTAAVAEAAKDRLTDRYIKLCLSQFNHGCYGLLPESDVLQNRRELGWAAGRVFGRYPAYRKMAQDIFIVGYFSTIDPCDIESNHTVIMYVSEY